MGGHWQTHTHQLRDRLIEDIVLIACMDGSGWLQLGGQTHAVNAGDLFCCPASVPHGYGNGPGGWTIYWVHCRGARVESLCRAAGFTVDAPLQAFAHNPRIREAFATLIDDLAAGGPDTPWIASRNLHTLLHALVWQRARPDFGATSLTHLIHSGCRNLDELVAASGYSRFHFCRLFRKQTGQTPWRFALDRKLERARELLLGSALSVKEIAAQLGFNNPDYFAKLFKRSTGVTPNRYRGRIGISPPPRSGIGPPIQQCQHRGINLE